MDTEITCHSNEIREEGRAEGKKEIAKAALKKGFSLEDVMEITGLDKQIVLKIKEELN